MAVINWYTWFPIVGKIKCKRARSMEGGMAQSARWPLIVSSMCD